MGNNLFSLYNQTSGQQQPQYYAEGQYVGADGNPVATNNPSMALGMLKSAAGAGSNGGGQWGGSSGSGAFQMGQALGGALGTSGSMGSMGSIVSAFL